MTTLRYYQDAAIDGLFAYFEKEKGNPLVVLPTGTGKSIVPAEFIKVAVEAWPDTRVVCLTHVRELIAQNFAALIRHWPTADAGVYSAGLGRKDIHSQILFAGIQSIYRHAYKVQRCDLLLIDEAHLIPRDASTMYGKFIADLLSINPHMKIIGFTATPFRMDSGMLHKGRDAMFHGIAYEMSILEAVEQGYLCEVVPKAMTTKLDVSGVGSRGGEFIAGELEKAVDVDAVTKAAVAEIIAYGTGKMGGAPRGSWLIFTTGVKHANHVCEEIQSYGITCAVITGDMPAGERDAKIAAYKRGEVRCLVNVVVLTIGFDAPATDLLGDLAPTKSAGRHIQKIGRGTRPIDGEIGNLPTAAERLAAIASSAKPNCLLLDFAGNTARHGPVDKIKVSAPGEGGGDAPIKDCPQCFTIVYAGVRVCPECGFEFPEPEVKLQAAASTAAVLSTQVEPVWCNVESVSYHKHEKADKPPSLRVEYHCQLTTHREWICLEHSGFARQKACAWWAVRAPGAAIPASVKEGLMLAGALPKPGRILVRPEGKFTEIVNYDFSTPPKHESNNESVDDDDDIPF